MKKIVSIALCMICVLMLVACGNNKTLPQNTTAETLASAIIDAVGDEPESNTTYVSKMQSLDTHTMSLWADGAYKECSEFALLDDYHIFYSADNSTYEISVLKAKTQDDVSKLASVLERRKQTLSMGDKAEYDPNFKMLMDDSLILTEGRFVMLIITPNNSAATKAIENLKQ